MDVARRRDIASFAQLFRTTRASLCQEWAAETLRAREQEPTSYAVSIASPFDARAPGRFEIAVARGTTAGSLLELELGSTVQATGPSGVVVGRQTSSRS